MEKNLVKISVIIPVYNAEDYLKRCLDSVVNQTYTNLEIILVNDGSTDASSRMIDDYAAADNRIVVIHKQNGGIGSAYRKAFDRMSGDYISFIDSDDYVALNYYEDIVQEIKKHDPDILHFGRILFNDQNEIIDNLKRYDEVLEGNDVLFHHHFNQLKDPSLACRVFKKDLFSEVKLFDQNIGIDEMIIVQVLVKSTKIVFLDKVYYFTYERQNSVSRIEYSEQKIRQGVRVYQFICDFLRSKKPVFSHHTDIKYMSYLMPIYELAIADKKNKSKEVQELLESDIHKYYGLTKNTLDYSKLPILLRSKLNLFITSKVLFNGLLSMIKLRKKILGSN